jgi:hypothetical protein
VDTSDPAHPTRAFVGRENVRKNWDMILKTFPDIRIEVVDSVTVGDNFWGEFHYIRPGAADIARGHRDHSTGRGDRAIPLLHGRG